MKYASGNADGIAGADPKDHVSDLTDRVITQKPLKIMLNKGHHDRTNNRQTPNGHQKCVHGRIHLKKVQRNTDQEINTQKFVQGRRQKGGHRYRGIFSRVRNPGMKRHGAGFGKSRRGKTKIRHDRQR